jgi:hypothetical protein
LIA